MQYKLLKRFLTTASILVLAATGANAATYNIAWTGSSGYSMTGLLMFDDALMGTGVIDETQIDELAIEVFLNGASQGSRSLATDGIGSTSFNLNFDTVAGQFVVGGLSDGSSGQQWFWGNSCSVGFISGSSGQLVCVEPSISLGFINVGQSTLVATFVAPVPLPAALPLFLAGLAGLGFLGWRTNRGNA